MVLLHSVGTEHTSVTTHTHTHIPRMAGRWAAMATARVHTLTCSCLWGPRNCNHGYAGACRRPEHSVRPPSTTDTVHARLPTSPAGSRPGPTHTGAHTHTLKHRHWMHMSIIYLHICVRTYTQTNHTHTDSRVQKLHAHTLRSPVSHPIPTWAIYNQRSNKPTDRWN